MAQEEKTNLETQINSHDQSKLHRRTSTNTTVKRTRSYLIIKPEEEEEKPEVETLSLNKDIYMVYVVLLAYNKWDKISKRDRKKFILTMIATACLQFCMLLFLLLEMILNPPWNNYSSESGSSALILSTKFCALICFTIYIRNEANNVFALLAATENVHEFATDRIDTFWLFFLTFTFITVLMALSLSVGLISTAETGL